MVACGNNTPRANAEDREFDPRVSPDEFEFFLFAILFFSRSFTCRIASCMHWEDEFRCISMIFGKFNVILVVFCYENILEPVSEMRAFFIVQPILVPRAIFTRSLVEN